MAGFSLKCSEKVQFFKYQSKKGIYGKNNLLTAEFTSARNLDCRGAIIGNQYGFFVRRFSLNTTLGSTIFATSKYLSFIG